MNYKIGVNYWGSKHAVDMWKNWDEESVKADVEALSRYGVRCMRVFPNWRDFQPIRYIFRQFMEEREMTFFDGSPLTNEYGIDYTMIERFRKLCDWAQEYGIELIVSIVTGWMSGMMFVPPAFEGKNCIKELDARSWMCKYIKGFVDGVKDKKAIVAWDIGNETNNIGRVSSRDEAVEWTQSIRNAIYAQDNTRPVHSGMHGLGVENRYGHWLIRDQGEICDVLSPHPYPSPTVGGHMEKMNNLRPTLVPTAQVELYSSIGKKPAMIQEQGTFSNVFGDEDCAADFMRVNIWSALANGSLGYLWWCAFDQCHINHAPYEWIIMENELGILRADYSPKKVALAMQKATEEIEGLPTLTPRKKDCVYIVAQGWEKCNYLTSSAYTLSKQAGLEMTFCAFDQPIPESKMYIFSSSSMWNSIYKSTYYEIMRRVHDEGATVLVCSNDCAFIEVEKFFGWKSNGRFLYGGEGRVIMDGESYPMNYAHKIDIQSVGAKVLAVDEKTNIPVFTCNDYGKGKVFFLDCAIDDYVLQKPNSINEYPYYKFYQKAGESILKDKEAVSNDPYIAVTIHPTRDGFTAVAVNYCDKDRACDIKWRDGVEITAIKGDGKIIPACDACIFSVKYKDKKN